MVSSLRITFIVAEYFLRIMASSLRITFIVAEYIYIFYEYDHTTKQLYILLTENYDQLIFLGKYDLFKLHKYELNFIIFIVYLFYFKINNRIF